MSEAILILILFSYNWNNFVQNRKRGGQAILYRYKIANLAKLLISSLTQPLFLPQFIIKFDAILILRYYPGQRYFGILRYYPGRRYFGILKYFPCRGYFSNLKVGGFGHGLQQPVIFKVLSWLWILQHFEVLSWSGIFRHFEVLSWSGIFRHFEVLSIFWRFFWYSCLASA